MIPLDPTNVSGTHQVRIQPESAQITFRHPHLAQPLTILSGANAIQWEYTLNTISTPTIGGEVIQVLSSFVGPMTIQGIAPDRNQQNTIKNWFLEYMHRAGTAYKGQQYRDEMAVIFSYPARGWEFYIMPTALEGFTFDKAVYAPPWSITAEIVSDNAINYLSGVSMSAFTGPLANPAFQEVGYSNPTGTGKASLFVNPLLSGDLGEIGQKMGDNFDKLIASYASGNFANFAYGALSDNNQLSPNIDAEYTKLFGSPYLSVGDINQQGTQGGTVGNIVYQGQQSLAQGANAQWITDVLSGINAPISVRNQNFMYSWWNSEGGGGVAQGGHNTANFNWLNTTLGSQYPAINSNNVRSYPDYQTGVKYTIQSLNTAIISALKTGNPYQDSADAVSGLQTWLSSGDPAQNAAYAAKILSRYSTSTALVGSISNAYDGGSVDTSHGFIFYDQGDSRWANDSYGASNIGSSGCGITSMAMAVTNLTGRSVTPKTLGANFGQFYIVGQGSSWGLFPAVAKVYGLQETDLDTDFAQATKIIQAGGYCIACGQGANPFTGSGHIIVLRGVQSGGFLIGDPDGAHPATNNTAVWSQAAIQEAGLMHLFGISQ